MSSLRLAGKTQQAHTQPGPKKTLKKTKQESSISELAVVVHSWDPRTQEAEAHVKFKDRLSFKGVKTYLWKQTRGTGVFQGQEHWGLYRGPGMVLSKHTLTPVSINNMLFFTSGPKQVFMSAFRRKDAEMSVISSSLCFYPYTVKSKQSASQRWHGTLTYSATLTPDDSRLTIVMAKNSRVHI